MSKNKHRSLENQMLHALGSAKSQGESKRSYRAEHGGTGEKIFSLNYETDLRETIKSVSTFLKENTDIKFLKDISREDLQSFLKEKSLTCNYNTCNDKGRG